MSTSSRAQDSSVQVVVRLRPMNEKEKKHGTLPVVTASTQDKTVTVIKGQGSRQIRSSFAFDNVFTAFSSQEEVFDETLKPVIGEVMKGYESTVFAYGQTGTGKTHTMEGDLTSLELQGVIPRSAKAIFEALKQPIYQEHTVTCSYLEIYNEELCDLLTDENHRATDKKGNLAKLEIMDGKKGTFCRGLVQRVVQNADDVLNLMSKAQNQRKIGETKMNKHSSRSHCIFTITVHAKAQLVDAGGIIDFTGKLHMVDLAGSECAKTASLEKGPAHTEVARERERMNINRSLLTLGRVISLLKEQSSSKKNTNMRIPYRDSKLTRILQESLGGRCKTVVIATLSPSITAIEESISTLNYAQSANGIVNKPVATSFLSINPSGKTCSTNLSKIASPDNNNSVEYWHEMECRLQYMQAQVEESQAALARKHMHQQELMDRADKAEEEKLVAEKKFYEASVEVTSLKEEVKREKEIKEKTKAKLDSTTKTLANTAIMLKATQQTEEQLTEEAKCLIKTLQESINNGEFLYETIRNNFNDEMIRRKETIEFQKKTSEKLKDMKSLLSEFSEESRDILTSLSNKLEENFHVEESLRKQLSSIVDSINKKVTNMNFSMFKQLDDKTGAIALTENTNTSVCEKIEEITKIIDTGEKSLSKVCLSGQKLLQQNGAIIHELNRLNSEKAQKSLASLETNISTSKSNISKMIGSAIHALSEARNERESVRTAHGHLLREWRESSLCYTEEIEKTTREEGDLVHGSIQHCLGEMKHFDHIDTTLQNQRHLVEKEGQTHMHGLTQQRCDLVKQGEMIDAANVEREKAQKAFLDNVMEGFQTIIRTQMQKLANEGEKVNMKLKMTNDTLQDSNISLDRSAKCIVDKVDMSSKNLINHVQSARANVDKMNEVMQGTNKKLEEMSETSKRYQGAIKDFSARADTNMSQFAQIDAGSDSMFENIKGDCERCSAHLTETVHKQAQVNFTELRENSEEMYTHCNDTIINECTSTFNDLMKPRNQIIESVNNNTEEIYSILHKGSNQIKQMAENLGRESEQCMSFVVDCGDTVEQKIVKQRREQMEATQEKISLSVSKLADVTNVNVTNSSVQMKAVKSQIEGYATNVIHINKDIAPIEDRKEWNYTEKLSSTPSEEELLEKCQESSHRIALLLDEVDISCDRNLSITIPVHEDKENNGYISRRFSGASELLSTKSGTSSTSSTSPHSPLLSERCMNDEKSSRKARKVPRSVRKPLSHCRSLSSRNVPTPSRPKSSISRKKSRAPTPVRHGVSKKIKTGK